MSRAALLIVLAYTLIACGCATVPRGDSTAFDPDCLSRFRDQNALIERYRVSDAQSGRVEGAPFLRSSRFLSSFSREVVDPVVRRTWIQAMAKLDSEARRHETANQPERLPDLGDCSNRLVEQLLGDEEAFQRVADKVQVGDAYRQSYRVMGLYPLTNYLLRPSIKRLHAETKARFAAGQPASLGYLNYAPASQSGDASTVIADAARDPLGHLELSQRQMERVFAAYAPVFSIKTASDADRIGTPYWTGTAAVAIDVQKPQVYTHLSYTRFEGRVLPQLNYIIWFPRRPKDGNFDLLGGELDGITWRLTLDEQGRPLLADSMHNCGCYHMFFPGAALQTRLGNDGSEPPLIPAQLPMLQQGHRYHLHIASGTHYLEYIGVTGPLDADIIYSISTYDELRSLPRPDGSSRSLFQPNGLVADSERLERLLLWPMGVPNAGAMRQWGHHATAFIGTRHFDEPYLLERYFYRP